MTEARREGVLGEWVKYTSSDDAVKLKSFDLCPNPICIAPSTSNYCPTPQWSCCSFLFCHGTKEKYNIPLWLQLPLCGNEWRFSFSFVVKEQDAVRYYYCQGFLKVRYFDMSELALTSSPDGALQEILFWWLDRVSNICAHSHTPNAYCSRLALLSTYLSAHMCGRDFACGEFRGGGWRLPPWPDAVCCSCLSLINML